MRTRPCLAAATVALAAILSCLSATSGRAQVDERALDQLGPAQGSATPPKARPRAPVSTGHAHPNGPHQTLPPLKESKPPSLAIPAAPPPGPVLPPPIVVPTRPQPPPLPAPVVPDAPGTATKLKDGLRVTFGGDHFELNPQTEAALRELAHSPPPDSAATFTITAYAAGLPEDPSTPRRVSLSRALSVRSVLVAAGVPSVRIYVKALGASMPGIADGPPDRVDVTVVSPPPAAAPPAAPAPSQKAAP